MTRREAEPLFLSTAIPYVNASPHIGFAFEAVVTDALARYHRARGRDVFFLTGTDDNSLKNVEAAENSGVATEEFVERNAEEFRRLEASLDLSFDDFIRTSKDARHFAAVDAIWNACSARGDIYEAEYSGLYCVGCEQFYSEGDLVDGLCPEHLRPPERVSERNWFFRLSRYQDALLDRIESRELRILPDTRRAEIVSFIRGGLEDFSISRSSERSRGWGLAVPGDASQVIYVWFDALTNYISALDFGSQGSLYAKYWVHNPDRIHVIGKGILRFHAAYWPAMLLSAGLPLPTTILVHGYLLTEGRKISKSLGDSADPHDLSSRFGPDVLRYYLLSQFPPANDGDFTVEQLRIVRDNDLADQLGNLVSRVAAMIDRYCDGRVPSPPAGQRTGETAFSTIAGLLEDTDSHVDAFEIDRAVRRTWDVVREANRYVVAQAPWQLARRSDDASREKLSSVLYQLVEGIRVIAAFVSPYIPSKATEIAEQFSLGAGWTRLSQDTLRWGRTAPGTPVASAPALFPKSREDVA